MMRGLARLAAGWAAGCVLSLAQAAPVEIHPAGPTVPENLLRIELRFGQPQSLPFDTGRLKLLDEKGLEIENALLDLALPDASGRRITVLLDPGRVKSGVGPNLDAGRALHAGETVSLRVDGAVTRSWQVTEAVSQPLDTDAWRLSGPRAGSRDPLVVDLREPVGASGELLIAVVDAQGRRVPGRATLGGGDVLWRFEPALPWRSGPHRLVTHPDLEDAAGNRRCAAFEQRRASSIRCDAGASIAFVPAAAPVR